MRHTRPLTLLFQHSHPTNLLLDSSHQDIFDFVQAMHFFSHWTLLSVVLRFGLPTTNPCAIFWGMFPYHITRCPLFSGLDPLLCTKTRENVTRFWAELRTVEEAITRARTNIENTPETCTQNKLSWGLKNHRDISSPTWENSAIKQSCDRPHLLQFSSSLTPVVP